MARGNKTRGAVDGRAVIIMFTFFDGAGMQRHTHLQSADFGIPGLFVQRMLRRYGAADTFLSLAKYSHKAVAGAFYHAAVITLNALCQQRIMSRQCSCHFVRQLFPEARTAHDVSKQNSDDSTRVFGQGSIYSSFLFFLNSFSVVMFYKLPIMHIPLSLSGITGNERG